MHGDNLVARLNRATKNPAAGALLQRLLFWHKNGKGRELEGKKWVPNSLAEWAEEAGLTVKQVRTAMKMIEDAHLAETKMAMYRTRKTLHVRPTQRAEAIAEGNFEEVGDDPSCPTGQGSLPSGAGVSAPGGTGKCPGGHSLYKEKTQGENKQKSMGGISIPQKDHGPELEGNSGMMMKDALEAAKAKTNKKLHKPDSMSALAAIWKQKVSAETGQMIGLMKKHEMMLLQFSKLCPPGKAEFVLEKVLDNWIGFAKRAESLAGAKNVPALPNVYFLLQNADTAVIFAQPVQSIAPPTPKSKEAPKAQSVPALQLISQDDDPEISYEEAVKLMKGQ